MDNNKSPKVDFIKQFIGDITIHTAIVERNINNAICRQFVYSKERELIVTKLLFNGGIKFNDKIKFLNFMSYFIDNKVRREKFKMAIESIEQLNTIKENVANGNICLYEDSDKVAIKTALGNCRYKYTVITPEYMGISRNIAAIAVINSGFVLESFNKPKRNSGHELSIEIIPETIHG
jgi:hypothetical protein